MKVASVRCQKTIHAAFMLVWQLHHARGDILPCFAENLRIPVRLNGSKRAMKMRVILPAILAVVTMSCSGHSTLTSSGVSGAYEFVVTSNVTGGVTLVEANLAASGNQSSASGASQVQILTLEKKIWYVNGSCAGSTPGQNSVSANLSENNIALTFDEGGNMLPGQGSLTGTTVSANYAVKGSPCPDLTGTLQYPPGTDQGGIVGNAVPTLAGTFSGTLNLPNGTDNATFTLTENGDQTLNVTADLNGTVDNGSFNLSGNAIGNVMFVSGTVSGEPLTLFGYFDKTGAYTKLPNTMLVFVYSTGSTAGLLQGQ